MNIEEYRPINIDKVIGQELPKTGLLAMLKSPYTAPKIVILSGPYGTGRKTLARNYVKSRYCTELEKSGSNCGTCEICRNILTNKEVYKEIDYSQIDTLTFAKNRAAIAIAKIIKPVKNSGIFNFLPCAFM